MYLILPAIFACVFPNIACLVNGLRLQDNIHGWFQTLKKPSWSPPDAVFGDVWTISNTIMGYASFLVWRDAGMTFGGDATLPLTLYAVQLAIAWSWSEICFGQRNLSMSYYAMLLADAVVFACGFSFYQVNVISGLIVAPYFAWLIFCTLVTYRLYVDNPDQDKRK